MKIKVRHNKIEEVLCKSESRYHSYLELTGQLSWITNVKGEVEEDIPAWRKFTGQKYEEVKGMGWSKTLHPDDLENTMTTWEKAVSAKIPYEIEYRIRRYDGVYRHFLVRGVPIFEDGGSIREWIGSCIDISERKKMEAHLAKHNFELESLNKSLKEESVKTKVLLESIGDGIIATDKKGCIIALNMKTEDIFNWKVKNVLGKSIFAEFNLTDEQGKIIPKNLRPIDQAMATNKVGHGIYFMLKKGIKRIPLFITSSPIILDDKVIGAINIYRDVSQQVAIDHAKDEFLHFASHTLRTPLSAMAWTIERLNEDTSRYSLEQKKSLNLVYDQTQRMIQLINDLLDATRMEFGILSYKYEETDPLEIADNVIADLRHQISEKRIKFSLISENKIAPYQTYSNAIYIILHNLLANAVKFTPIDGIVSLKIIKTKKDLILQITDSGIGIPKLAKTKILQKRYRASNVKDKFEGNGLGLYLIHGIVNNMSGKIEVESEQGKGSIFTITLPLKLETTQTKERIHP